MKMRNAELMFSPGFLHKFTKQDFHRLLHIPGNKEKGISSHRMKQRMLASCRDG